MCFLDFGKGCRQKSYCSRGDANDECKGEFARRIFGQHLVLTILLTHLKYSPTILLTHQNAYNVQKESESKVNILQKKTHNAKSYKWFQHNLWLVIL